MVSLAALQPGSRHLRKARWHPGALQPKHLCLNAPRGPSLAYDWAPARLPLGTAAACRPWNPAPNHSCLAWGLTVCPLLSRVFSLSPQGWSLHHTLSSAAPRGPASALRAQTFFPHLATCLSRMFLSQETLSIPHLHIFVQIPWKVTPSSFTKPLGESDVDFSLSP